MTRENFEKIVSAGIKAIPDKFLKKLNNVAIVIEDFPDTAQKNKLGIRSGSYSLFGLYEGVPQTARRHYSGVLPDKITIFQKPIEAAAKSEDNIKKLVTETVWHEIAHHFGIDEKTVRKLERKKFNK